MDSLLKVKGAIPKTARKKLKRKVHSSCCALNKTCPVEIGFLKNLEAKTAPKPSNRSSIDFLREKAKQTTQFVTTEIIDKFKVMQLPDTKCEKISKPAEQEIVRQERAINWVSVVLDTAQVDQCYSFKNWK